MLDPLDRGYPWPEYLDKLSGEAKQNESLIQLLLNPWLLQFDPVSPVSRNQFPLGCQSATITKHKVIFLPLC